MERDVNLELSHSVRRYVLRARIKVQILDCELIEEIVGKTGWCNSQYLNVNDFTSQVTIYGLMQSCMIGLSSLTTAGRYP